MALGPFDILVSHHPWWSLGPILIVAGLTGWLVQGRLIGPRLRTPATPKSPILAWERARTEARMTEILTAWGAKHRRLAGASLGWDIPFLLTYGVAMSLLCSMAARFYEGTRAPVGKWIFGVAAWLALVAAAFDLLEDLFLWRSLRAFDGTTLEGGDAIPRRMFWFSSKKWALIGIVAPLSVGALLVDLVRR